jgi:Leucine-rich repeat (LRR) protein
MKIFTESLSYLVLIILFIACARSNNFERDKHGLQVREMMHYSNIDSLFNSEEKLLALDILGDTAIRFLPKKIASLVGLKEISVTNCYNLDLDSLFKLLSKSSVTTLELSHNDIQSLPGSVKLMSNLKHLIINDESVDYLPKEIGELKLVSLEIISSLTELSQKYF